MAWVCVTLSAFILPNVAAADGLAGQLGHGQSDFGGVGIMQTPTARMNPLGEMSVSASRTAPYRRYNVFLQPTRWFEGGFRYVSVENRPGPLYDRNLDKGFDAKLRLLEETRYWPQLAVGARDIGGTTLFGAEYVVASKRWGNFDFTAGLGWGYLGTASDIDSPFGWLADRFDNRSANSGSGGGELNFGQYFAGSAAVFGGVEYQTPWDPLILQLEYEGNDYSNEPQDNDQVQDSRFNVGARLAISDNVELHTGWQRGNTAMAGITFNLDLNGLDQLKNDPPLQPLDAAPQASWAAASQRLNENAGMQVERISRQGDSLTVTARPGRFRSLAQSEGRANRILNAQADEEIETFRFDWEERGLPLRESVHDREQFVEAATSADHEYAYRYGIYTHARLEDGTGETLHQAPAQRFNWQLGPRLDQNFGGPDGYLYRLKAQLSAEYQTDPNGWFSGSMAWTVADNLGNYEYIANSRLPRVRTFVGDYLSESPFGIENLQYTRTAKVSDNVYAMGYGGILEMMYAGVGAEWLYREFDAPWALGADINWVRQRDFDQRFDMRDYSVWTGHINAYVETGVEDVLAKLSVGRYLAGDIGATLDLSREFDSGVRVGAWGTLTDAGDDFGEGSFDKGLYLTIPLDAFFTFSSRNSTTLRWQPLTRDGGARLSRRYDLYTITQERDLDRYWQQYDTMWQ
ncbi:YjbH domain-containing protein [Halomonas sp. PAMB 3232]|uniref:YjbH domain-containing protein n=1 Tax=Halomonas sp. PAMB 3232 TaxID=3075221 RepID=UPI002899FAF4|nr:YjbH domain-containing protein [Halomonas sp. PAMB 3232]WNL39563.1 YjbH domain-containing protein [Halomonas sp. PAMB 3232]